MTTPPPLTPQDVKKWVGYAESSPLYRHLTHVISEDDDLLSVLNRVQNTPRQNILFAGIQFLLLKGGDHELADFYPNLVSEPRALEEISIPFKEFVLGNVDALVEIGTSRYTQTNECRRCVALLPGIWATPESRFHLVDFGTSAGLNLNVDRYKYRWGSVTWGTGSSLTLETDSRGVDVVPREIELLSRTGLDLNPIDLGNDDDRLWLEALVWPEHHERRKRLGAALEIAADHPPRLVAGDAFETLEQTLSALPAAQPVVVINSFVLNQYPTADRARLDEIIGEAQADRSVCRVSLEWLDPDARGADLKVDIGSGLTEIGMAHPHGDWVELYALP